jgi:hypothetical protein
MQPHDFPPNARTRPTRDSKVVEKVITGQVIQRKKTFGQRFMGVFVGGEARNVGQYIVQEILVPAFKDLFFDMVSQGTERMIFGDTRSASRRTTRHSSGYTNYNRVSRPGNPWDRNRDDRPMTPKARAIHDFDQIILNTRSEAEEVLTAMYDLLERYQQVTVSDLYNLVGITSAWTDEAWGWDDLSRSGVTRVSGGYLLDLPKTIKLD